MDNTFDPNQAGVANGNFFALPVNPSEADLVLVSVPWDVTTSYRAGTSEGPEAIIEASSQVDLFDPLVPMAWEIPIAGLGVPEDIKILNQQTRIQAEAVIEAWENGAEPESVAIETEKVNEACSRMNEYVYKTCLEQLNNDKIVGLVGGEHSVPLGFLQALSDRGESFGILHIDAHADLRCAYENFTFSHASIMYNALHRVSGVKRLVQVGIRDFCQNEDELIHDDSRISCYTDSELRQGLFEGLVWREQCLRILGSLPDKVYVSLDIDGLDPSLCPNTGTPVPGGLSFREVDYLLYNLAVSGKTIIGFDLCEVAPGAENEWDANVGARILYKLCCYTYLNRQKNN